jgi:hypothetical protein
MLSDSKQLTVLTTKRSSGCLVTSVSVGTLEGGFITHKVYDDYSRNWLSSNHKRITSKVVEAQHDSISIDLVLDDVCLHYSISRSDLL